MAEVSRKRPVVLVGAGERARAWGEVVRAAAGLELVGLVSRHAPESGPWDGVPRQTSLSESLARHPDAAFLVALPPRAGLEAALELSALGREAVVQAPLDLSLPEEPEPNDRLVRVAHGWNTLPGQAWCRKVMERFPPRRATLQVRGLPESAEGEPKSALVHALALVRGLFPAVRLERAHQPEPGRFELGLSAGGCEISLLVLPTGRRLELRMQRPGMEASWEWDGEEESVHLKTSSDSPPPLRRRSESGAVRALRQLASPGGDTLEEARAVAALAREAMSALPGSDTPGRRALRASVSLARRHPERPLLSLGLDSGERPRGSIEPIATHLPTEPMELWTFRAGLKPVAFLTVAPEGVEEALRPFGEGLAVERLDRRVLVGAQDEWTDERHRGEPRVELYVSRDPELAKKASRIQASSPSGYLREMGALLGYPSCCVEAFVLQEDRANNSGNRYASAARTRAGAAWPWELNNLFWMILPFYPCRYDCPEALVQARRSLSEMEKVHPGIGARLKAYLGKPVLYFDHERMLVLEGSADRHSVRGLKGVYRPPEVSADFASFGRLVASAESLSLAHHWLELSREGQTLRRFRRTDPALGFLAPFGD